MNQIIKSIELTLKNRNWVVALIGCLTLPDICGKIDEPQNPSTLRYVNWFNKYLQDDYTSVLPEIGKHIFLTGDDCYALRCSYIHEGTTIIEHPKVLEDFKFILPKNGSLFHRNQKNKTLYLQIDIFCKEMLNAVNNWLEDIKMDSVKQKRLVKLFNLYDFPTTF